MSRIPAEVITAHDAPLIRPEQLDPRRVVRRIAGRNRTKADVLVYETDHGRVAVKDFGPRPWLVRQIVGRLLIRREARAYAVLAGLPGLPRFLGRVGPFRLATRWVDGRRLADCVAGEVPTSRFETLREIVDAVHARGVTLGDLNYRDVLFADDGAVHVVDFATAFVRGERPGPLRRRMFERFRASDRFALARLRARFTGEDPSRVIADADPRVLAWHRRARRLKWCWDRLRGAERLPPVNDHWRF